MAKLSKEYHGYKNSMQTFMESEGKKYTPPVKVKEPKKESPAANALRVKTGHSKSGVCAKCRANATSSNPQKPPLHPNCKCSQLTPFKSEMIPRPQSLKSALLGALKKKIL